MTKSDMVARFREARAFVPDRVVKLDFGPDGVVLFDGVAGVVTETDGDADATLKLSWDDWKALATGDLAPMAAFLSGRLKVEGDLSAAMRLQEVLAAIDR